MPVKILSLEALLCIKLEREHILRLKFLVTLILKVLCLHKNVSDFVSLADNFCNPDITEISKFCDQWSNL